MDINLFSLKISPDETKENLKLICKSIVENEMDGIICSNTTIEEKNASGGVDVCFKII